MSLNAALDFASRGYAVLPATANKQPLTRHGVIPPLPTPMFSPSTIGAPPTALLPQAK